MRLVSFDIFDTILIRKSFSPNSIFQIIAARLFHEDSEMLRSWISWREEIDRNMWRKKLHYKLEDIYQELEVGSFSPYTPDEMMAIELQVESESLVSNVQIREIIGEYRQKGYQIAFISDMYLPSSFLKSILKRELCWENGDLLYVSCEEMARKSSGELFKKVNAELKPKEWIHYGDNQISDIKNPTKLGIKTVKVDTSKIGIECIQGDFRISAALRTVRIQLGNTALARLSSHYVAPLYVPYVRWVIHDAKQRGIRRLYFLSRDAYILMCIAEKVPHEDIDLCYLFASRKSLKKEEEKDNTVFYLEQEGVFENIKKAIVDVGWFGTTRKMINEIVGTRSKSQIFFYYFSVWQDCLSKEYGDYASFINTPILNREITSFIEDFCSLCPYPTTIGYIRNDKGWIPAFPNNHIYQKSLIVQSNIDACLKYSSLIDQLNISEESLYKGVEMSMSHLFSFQDPIDFSPLVDLPGCDGHPAVKRLSFVEIWKILFGELVSLNDRASLEVTVGLFLMRIVWKIHNFSYRLFQH